jgi:hypothetical protein
MDSLHYRMDLLHYRMDLLYKGTICYTMDLLPKRITEYNL